MSRKIPFTDEQIQVLQQNPFTHSVTPNAIVFTLAFKQMFYEQTKVPGMSTRKIMLKAGYDPTWFTKTGLDHIRRSILQQAASPEGLRPPRGLSPAEKTKLFEEKDLSRQRTDTTIRQMQDRIVHLENQPAGNRTGILFECEGTMRIGRRIPLRLLPVDQYG